jgi:GT2 family glycosyltransferase
MVTSSLPPAAIVILNWNDEPTTARALQSLRQADLCGATIILVDSASEDGSAQNLLRRFPEIHLLQLPENRGYAGGCNAGIREAFARGCEAVFVMNNDVIVAPDFLRPLLEKASEPDVGIVGGKIYLPGEPARFQSAGAFIHDWTGETCNRFEGLEDVGQGDTEFYPDYLLGAAFLLTRRLVEKIGAFDERLFIYYEETDLCVRARRAGFKVVYVPRSRVWHCEKPRRKTSKQSWEQYYMLRNRIIFMRRYAGKHQRFVFRLYMILYRIPRELLRSFCGRAGTPGNVFRAVLDGMRFSLEREAC